MQDPSLSQEILGLWIAKGLQRYIPETTRLQTELLIMGEFLMISKYLMIVIGFIDLIRSDCLTSTIITQKAKAQALSK
jgi:hypothetical protein